MINRREFEDYLCNRHNCELLNQRDVAVRHTVNGVERTLSLGNHAKVRIHVREARNFIWDLGFTGNEFNEICDEWRLNR